MTLVVQMFSRSLNDTSRSVRMPIIDDSNGLCYKPMMIINDNSRVINKLEASLSDDARVVIYDRHMFM